MMTEIQIYPSHLLPQTQVSVTPGLHLSCLLVLLPPLLHALQVSPAIFKPPLLLRPHSPVLLIPDLVLANQGTADPRHLFTSHSVKGLWCSRIIGIAGTSGYA
ncbi:hypothetical protein B0T17DRAFT_256607 [Bombardia bombarda]|uniref:Uncharacterized protein n=1 Tax=Bombardia bombarda TaxID=252184 RepID=A0AA39X0C8_9PEZI|nr:hypothetical protein B0T17DRAFT_256607 [Bombardia bombarda]